MVVVWTETLRDVFCCCTVPGYSGGLLAVLVGVPFIFILFYFCIFFYYFLFFFSFCFKRGFYCWVIILNFSSFSIILFAVDLSFPTCICVQICLLWLFWSTRITYIYV